MSGPGGAWSGGSALGVPDPRGGGWSIGVPSLGDVCLGVPGPRGVPGLEGVLS